MTVINPQEIFVVPDLDPETAALFARFAENLLQYVVLGDVDELDLSANAPAELVLASAEEGGSTSAAVDANAAGEELLSGSSADTADACASAERVASTISGRCDGAIRAIQAINSSDESAARIAIKMGFFDPSAVNESAALQEDTRFVEYEDGSIKVFDLSGKEIAAMDCDGNVTNYFGDTPEERMIDTVPCLPAEAPAQAGDEPAFEEPVSEPTPEPAVVEIEPERVPDEPESAPAVVETEPEPEPEPIPVADRVRIFNTPTIVCDGEGSCTVAITPFLVFDSRVDAEEFFASDAGKSMLRAMTDETGATMGNCVYITDGERRLEQVSLKTVDRTVGGVTIKELVLTDDGVPQLDGRPYTSTFFDDNGRKYTLNEDDFESRYARGIGDVSDARHPKLPDVKESSTFGVGNPQELKYDQENDRWTMEYSDESISETSEAMIDASGLTPAEYEALKTMPLPAEFYDPDATIAEKARMLRAAADARGIAMSEQGATNMARIITELGFGQDAGMTATNESLVLRSDIALGNDVARPITGPVTLDQAVRQSAMNREIILTRFITG